MDKKRLEAMHEKMTVVVGELARRVNEHETARKAVYEDFLRFQGRLGLLNELLRLEADETEVELKDKEEMEG